MSGDIAPFEIHRQVPQAAAGNDIVAIVGYGRFGRALGQLLVEAGVALRAYDPHVEVPREHRVTSIHELVSGATFVVVAVPVARVRAALIELKSELLPTQI